ncbi:hypothetical protein VDGL01_12238 [Verticillium dahliae]
MKRFHALIGCSNPFTSKYLEPSKWTGFCTIKPRIEEPHSECIFEYNKPELLHIVTSQSELSNEEGFATYISHRDWKSVHIVSHEWLKECLRAGKRIEEGQFRWELPARMEDPEYNYLPTADLKGQRVLKLLVKTRSIQVKLAARCSGFSFFRPHHRPSSAS